LIIGGYKQHVDIEVDGKEVIKDFPTLGIFVTNCRTQGEMVMVPAAI
jgi:hypothetical protein